MEGGAIALEMEDGATAPELEDDATALDLFPFLSKLRKKPGAGVVSEDGIFLRGGKLLPLGFADGDKFRDVPPGGLCWIGRGGRGGSKSRGLDDDLGTLLVEPAGGGALTSNSKLDWSIFLLDALEVERGAGISILPARELRIFDALAMRRGTGIVICS